MTVVIYSALGAFLFALGVLGLFVSPSAMRSIVAINVASVGVLTMMVSLAARVSIPDPVLHAMVLTGLVVAVSATAFALAIVRRIAQLERDEHCR